MEVPEGCKMLKVQRTCHSGFLWAYEFLNYPGVTKNKKRLVNILEDHMKSLLNKPARSNFTENQFVAVKSELKTGGVVRGYILLFTPDGKGGTYDVFLIDYGKVEKVNGGDLREMPAYASVEQIPAQSWRIGIYGVLPLYIELNFGEPAVKKVGDSWNGKDITFIENVLRDYDTIEFQEVKRYQEYRFGYIYLKDTENQSVTTLQKLLVDRGYAVEEEDFDKRIPAIVKRIKSTSDHASFPTGEEFDDSDFNDLPDAPFQAKSPPPSSQEPISSQSSETSSNVSKIPVIPAQTSPQSSISASVPSSKGGKGRGDLLKKLQLQKPPPLRLSPMIGRLPLNVNPEEFDDSSSVYGDAVSSPSFGLSPSSSVEFLTPRNGSPSMSRRQSSSLSSSVEITGVTRARNQSEIQTISLITPPKDPAIISLVSPNDKVPTIDLTTPPTVSLITPSPSPPDRRSSGNGTSGSGSTPSVSRRSKGRGELLQSLSTSSQSSMYSASSQDDLNEKLAELKLMSAPLPAARGRGALMPQLYKEGNSSGGTSAEAKSPNPSTNETPAPAKPSKTTRIDFAKDIVEIEPIRVDSDYEEQLTLSDDDLDTSDPQDGLMDKSISKIMVVGNEGVCRFKPKYGINDFDLHPSVKLRAGQLRLQDLRRCQRYMIAAMLTRRNVTLVDASKTGKTVSCLIALFSLLKDDKFYKALPVGPGPKAIILCPYSSQCESIDRQCKELNKSVNTSSVFPGKESLKINVAYGSGYEAEKDKLRELTQGYDIVITTPKCLIRLLQTPEMMNLKRLCHLVMDDADTLFTSYREEMDDILDQAFVCSRKHKEANNLILPQHVIISKQWMPIFKARVLQDTTKQTGVLLVASFYEAAIFSKVSVQVRRKLDEDAKNSDLLEYLNVEAPKKSTVIVFNTVEKMNETYNWLKSKCMRPISKVSYHLGSADDIVASWKRSVDKQEYPIMCCTDSTLHDLHIHEANCLIHYNLPPQERGYFNDRFGVFLYRLAGPPEFYTPGKMPLMFSKPESLIYMEPDDRRQLPAILQFVEKLKGKIPEDLENERKLLLRERILEKDGNAFCENYKKFGRCMDERLCKSRHYFSQKYDQPAADIPRQGSVKMQILQVYSASHYCVRLLEHRSGSGKWNAIKSTHPGVLNARVNMYFSDRDKRTMHICKNVGEVAAIETTTNMFKRVQVLEMIMDERTDELRTVKVKFIDDGKVDDVRPSVLVKLSDELASIPPTSVDVFLTNILPVDRDIEWGDIINSKVQERIQTMQESEDVLFIGEIKLVAGRDVWMDPLQCHKLYDKGKEVIVIMSSMRKDLLKKKLAEENANHLPTLLSMYRSADLLELPESEIEPVIESPRVENVVEVRSRNEPERKAEQGPSSNVDIRTNNTNGNDSHRREATIASAIWSNPIETVNESPSLSGANASSEPGSSWGVAGQPNHSNNDSADHGDDSEEEWPLADEPQTAAAPAGNLVNRNSPLMAAGQVKNRSDSTSQNDDSDSEYDQYDYEDDEMPVEGLLDDGGFDCYFSPEATELLINQVYPGFGSYRKALEDTLKSERKAIEPKRQQLTIREVDESESRVPRVPAIAVAPADMNTHVFKPNVEWYQDTEFVYMNISLNVDDYTIRIESDRIYFRATYDTRVYEFDEALYSYVDESSSKHYKSSVMVNVKMEKIIKRNKWPRIFKNKLATGWIKKSNEHLDEDIQIPEMCWDHNLNPGLAIKEPEIPNDFTYISNYNNTNVTIYPDGYEDYLADSDSDSDGVGNDNDGEE